VDVFLGEQFALPVAVDSVRAMRKLEPAAGTITLSAADPLNLVGILVPGDRVPAISGNSVTYRSGAVVEVTAVKASAGDEAVAS
jgi:ATP-dependent Lhr-like helicase